MNNLDKRLSKLENQQVETAFFDSLTINPISIEEIETDTRRFISVNSPFGMALKPVSKDHPRGMTKREHLKAGNDIAIIAI